MASKPSSSRADVEAAEGGESPALLGAAAAPIDSTSSPSVARVDSQLQNAAHFKMEGNAFYKEKKVRSAIGRYHRALMVLRGLDPEVTKAVQGLGYETPVLTPGQEELLRNTQVDCYNNLAACLLQRQSVDYTRVQEYSLRVLRWRPGDVKALYRAGVATLELGDAQTAKQYLTQACRGQPNDANVRKHLQRANEELSREFQKERAMYRGMFSSGPKTSSGDGADNQSNGLARQLAQTSLEHVQLQPN